MLKVEQVMVLAPHADDESLGCGGWLSHMSRKMGVRTHVCLVTCGDVNMHQGNPAMEHRHVKGETRWDEFTRACAVLGVAETENFGFRTRWVQVAELIPRIEASLMAHRPDTVVIPGMSYHQDHRAVHQAAMAALRPRNTPFVKNLLAYEISNYIWQLEGEAFIPNLYFELDDQTMADKLAACAVYESQNLHTPIGQEEVVRLACRRGAELHPLPAWPTDDSHTCDQPRAEAYRLLRGMLQ